MSLSSGARTNDQDLGDILLATHIIEEPALAQARRESKRTGRPLWRLLTRDGQVTEDALFRALRQEVRVPVLAADQLKSVVVPPELREALPHKVAQRLGILPLERSTDGRRAAMAMIDPTADISAMWPTFTALGVTEVRRFLVHPSTLRLGLEFFYGVPWQDEHEQAGDVDLAEVTPIIPRSAITQPLSAPTAQPPASVMVDPRLQDEFARMDGPTDPSARAMRSGGGQSEPMFSLARAAITGEVPRLVAPGLVSDSKRELLSAVTPRRAEASSASLRPVSPSKVPVSAPAIAAAASISGEMSAYRARREISIPELQASDIMLDEDQPMKLDPESMMPQSEPVQEALIKVCDLVLATLERELHVKRPEAMSRLAQALGERLGFAPRSVRELMLVTRLYGMLRLRLLRDGALPPARQDLLGYQVDHPLMLALRELQTVMVDFMRLPTEPDMVPMGARIVDAVIIALELLERGVSGDDLTAELRKRTGDHELTMALTQIAETDLQALGIEGGIPEVAAAALPDAADRAVPPPVAAPAAPAVSAPVPAAPAAPEPAPATLANSARTPKHIPPVTLPTPPASPTLLLLAPRPPRMPEVAWKTAPIASFSMDGLESYAPAENSLSEPIG